MKKTLCLFFALLLPLTLCGCGEKSGDSGASLIAELDAHGTDREAATIVFSLSVGGRETNIELYGLDIRYVGDVTKVGTLDESAPRRAAAALELAGAEALNGLDRTSEGEDYISLFVEFSDGTIWGGSALGAVPEDVLSVSEALSDYFAAMTEALPVYVPQVNVSGEVDETLLAAVRELISAGFDDPDSFYVSARAPGLASALGLADASGIAAAAHCGPNMDVTPYSLVVVSLDGTRDAGDLADDFIANADYDRWVCVLADRAAVCARDDLLLCVVGSGALFDNTLNAASALGWTTLRTGGPE